jgi:hypothetical protein
LCLIENRILKDYKTLVETSEQYNNDALYYKDFSLDLSTTSEELLLSVENILGGMYVMPLFLENVKGYRAINTGLILLLAAIGSAVIMSISGKLFEKNCEKCSSKTFH